MSRQDRILDLLQELATAYPRYTLTEASVGVYLKHLEICDVESLRRAVDQWIGLERWFPAVSELKKLATDLKEEKDSDKMVDKRRVRIMLSRDVYDAKQAARRGEGDLNVLTKLKEELFEAGLDQNAVSLDRYIILTQVNQGV